MERNAAIFRLASPATVKPSIPSRRAIPPVTKRPLLSEGVVKGSDGQSYFRIRKSR